MIISFFFGDVFIESFIEICRRPGILVLIGDTDWEILGAESCMVENNEKITFISTLHGG